MLSMLEAVWFWKEWWGEELLELALDSQILILKYTMHAIWDEVTETLGILIYKMRN